MNKNGEDLEFGNLIVNVSYSVENEYFEYKYNLQHLLYKFEKNIKLKFNPVKGFYFWIPFFGGLGGAGDPVSISDLNINVEDFREKTSKEYIVEINRKLGGNTTIDAAEELCFYLVPNKPCKFRMKISLLNEDKKEISNSIIKNYITLFTSNF